MRIAVSGATGFIGRHVLQDLAEKPVDVVAIVRNASQTGALDSPVDYAVIDVTADISDSYTLLGRPDVMIHLAWGCLQDYRSLYHLESELPNQFRFLSGLVKAGLPALVVSGTCLEYGMHYGPLDETHQTSPCTAYGYAKNALRCQLEFLRHTTPFALTWARIFYTYGEGQCENALWPQLNRAVARRCATFAMSGGEQLRDYLPVKDIASALVRLALQQTDAGIVNICSGKPVSVRALVEQWIDENRWTIGLNRGVYPYPDYEPIAFWGDRRKLDKICGAV